MIGGSAVDAMVMVVNRRVSIVMVGAALNGLRVGRFSLEEVDVESGGPG